VRRVPASVLQYFGEIKKRFVVDIKERRFDFGDAASDLARPCARNWRRRDSDVRARLRLTHDHQHVDAIFTKLEVENRAAAILRALEVLGLQASSYPMFGSNAAIRSTPRQCQCVPECMKTLHRVSSEAARVATAL